MCFHANATRRSYFEDVNFAFIFDTNSDGGLEDHDVSKLSKDILDTIEADSFWCMSKLLDGIQVKKCFVTFLCKERISVGNIIFSFTRKRQHFQLAFTRNEQ